MRIELKHGDCLDVMKSIPFDSVDMCITSPPYDNLRSYNSSNIWDIPPEKNNKTGHPAVFPVSIARDHIATWSNVGDTILDCFMGSGTTGIACKELNRNFIGIEKDEVYFKIAEKRINQMEISS